MFDQTFVNTHAHTRRPWTVAASLTLQTGLVAVAVILPMLHPEILRPKLEVPLYLPMRPKPQPVQPEPMRVQQTRSSAPRPRVSRPPILTVPTAIPAHVAMVTDAPELPASNLAFPGLTLGGSMRCFRERPASCRNTHRLTCRTAPVVKPEPPRRSSACRHGSAGGASCCSGPSRSIRAGQSCPCAGHRAA